jgi:Na+/proline symporter
VAYGVWHTRSTTTLDSYLLDDKGARWWTVGLSIMATQASAITFLSTPGMAYSGDMSFIQLYIGLPVASVLVARFAVPRYRKANVYTAYEYLEKRFDVKTRTLAAGLFLIQRGLASGITIFAPSLILATLLDWHVGWTSMVTGLLVVVYTVTGGSKAVNVTQTQQMAVMMGGLVLAAVMVVLNLPQDVSFSDAMTVAAEAGKFKLVDSGITDGKFDWSDKYNIFAGILAATFLSLSYFGTDQSQVGRYLGAKSEQESKMGLYMNALLKLPMQALILFVGVMLFVFYQFSPPPALFNKLDQEAAVRSNPAALAMHTAAMDAAQTEKAVLYRELLNTPEGQRKPVLTRIADADKRQAAAREAAQTLAAQAQGATQNRPDNDRAFLHFILHKLPIGVIGFLLAMVFSASMSSIASELNALSATTLIDVYKRHYVPHASDDHYLRVSKVFTLGWGLFAIAFAWFAERLGSLIEAVNVLGSLFYGTILGVFIATLIPRIRGNHVFVAALISEAAVLICYAETDIAYLWFNALGAVLTVGLAWLFSWVKGKGSVVFGNE